MRRFLGGMNANTVIAVAALVTSVVAVIVAWDESRLLRRSQEAAFLPIIEVRQGFDRSADSLAVTLSVRNSGQGVAIVSGGELRFDGEAVESYEAFADDALTAPLGRTADFSFQSLAGYYAPGEARELLRFTWPDEPAPRRAFEAFVEEKALRTGEVLRLRVCYCSVFDKCWTTDGRSEPDRAPSCEGASDPVEPLYAGYLAMRSVGEAEE